MLKNLKNIDMLIHKDFYAWDLEDPEKRTDNRKPELLEVVYTYTIDCTSFFFF